MKAIDLFAGAIEERTISVCPQVCPYGSPGDLLYVRETWQTSRLFDMLAPRQIPNDAGIAYATESNWNPNAKTRVSIHMPRWASRLTLRITDVRVERLQDISEEDAKAEGLMRIEYKGASFGFEGGNPTGYGSPTGAFRALWESINGPESWSANPWVWCLSFEVIHANVDQVLQEAA